MNKPDELELALDAYVARKISANELLRRAKPVFHAFALHSMRRWSTPVWLAVEDVEQEIMLEAWRVIENYSSDIGVVKDVTLRHYVAYNAYAAAKKKIHTARLGKRPHRDEGKARSRFEITASMFVAQGCEDSQHETPIDRASSPPEQEDAVGRRNFFERIAQTQTGPKSIICLMALAEVAGASVEAAGLALYSDPVAREVYRFGDEDAAIRLVAQVVADVSESSWAELVPDSERAA